jgi:hypothetical protein
MNFFGTHGDKEPQNFVIMLPEGGMDFIKTQLNKFRKASAVLRDTKWPDYMFGDVTDPETGLLAWSTLKPIFGDKTANTLTFSKLDDSSADVTVVPITQEILARRLNFFDLSSIHVPTPQEVLNMVIEDGVVPLEFIREACGQYLDVPEAPTKPSNWDRAQESMAAPQQQKASQPPKADPLPKSNPLPDEDPDDDIPFHNTPPAQSPAKPQTTLSQEELDALTSNKATDAGKAPVDYAAVLAQLEQLKK